MRLTIVGNPDNRRVTLFSAAVVAAGSLAPEVLPWRVVAAGEPFAFASGALVRIESPGEDAEVRRLFTGGVAGHGEIVGGRAWYLGLCRALGRLRAAADLAGATLLGDPAEIAVLFDKAACHARLTAAGIPVPPALPTTGRVLARPAASAPRRDARPGTATPGSGWEELRDALDAVGWSRVFVKPRHGSSASGVLALRRAPGRTWATTSVELVRDGDRVRLFNSLRVRTYRDERDVAAIVDHLAPDGLHVERWFPKAGLDGRTIDLRVLVLAGRPGHVVVRASHSPMTNLHLGGTRGDLDALRRAAGPDAYAAAMATCARVAAQFPGSPHVGVDLMFAPGWTRHAVAEVNAFGDLLPGLLVDGRDPYETQVAALRTRAGRLGTESVASGAPTSAGTPGVEAAALLPGAGTDATSADVSSGRESIR
ncbi:STM4014 family protein [Longispora sp. NPDC051575]|uniref:STM4014 family protein n=1 Tax=Longispora sp. NPDC051575 TaxID=3154943 RepID=UPI003418D239